MEAVRNKKGEIIDFRWLLMNDTAIKKIGNLLGRHLLEHYSRLIEGGLFEDFKQVVETGINKHYEHHYQHDGLDLWSHQVVVKLNDGIVNSTKDISEQKRAQEEILRLKDEVAQKATDKYLHLFNSIDEGFC